MLWQIIPKIRNLQVGLRVWSGGEIFSKKINKKWRAHNASPPIITKVNTKFQLSKKSFEGENPSNRKTNCLFLYSAGLKLL